MKEIILLILFLLPTIASAIDFNEQISDSDKTTFDKMFAPISKVYNLTKYFVSVIAIIYLSYASILFMISGSDTEKRNQAKTRATGVIIGLIAFWAIPLLIDFLTGG
jgi:hypothetical protein